MIEFVISKGKEVAAYKKYTFSKTDELGVYRCSRRQQPYYCKAVLDITEESNLVLSGEHSDPLEPFLVEKLKMYEEIKMQARSTGVSEAKIIADANKT